MPGDLITGDYQMQLGTLLLGAGTPYEIEADTGLVGWDDLPGLDVADVPRPGAPGAWPGTIQPQSRIITIQMSVHNDGAGHAANIAALRAATTATLLAGETPFAVQLGGQMTFCNARCLQRSLPNGDNYAGGRTPKALVQLEATDPRRYSPAQSSAVTGPPAATSGITWPVTWPITWPAGTAGGTVNVVNSGDFNTPLTISIRGPLTTPAVYRLDTGDVLELNTTMAAGDVAIVDTLAGTVTMNGSTANLLTDRSAPVTSFLMPPGTTGLALRGAVTDPAASMTVNWRSAYL